jgi:hypothetical protein
MKIIAKKAMRGRPGTDLEKYFALNAEILRKRMTAAN